MNIKPLVGRVVVKSTQPEETTKSGIVLTSASKEKPQISEVVAVGPDGILGGNEVKMTVKVGDKVRIVSGPFSDFIGDITEVYPDKSKLRASVSIFGRETPVELEYKQIQKV